jgi:hypothetical protein
MQSRASAPVAVDIGRFLMSSPFITELPRMMLSRARHFARIPFGWKRAQCTHRARALLSMNMLGEG